MDESKLSKVELWDLNSQSTIFDLWNPTEDSFSRWRRLTQDGPGSKQPPAGASGGAPKESYAILMLEIHGNAAAAPPVVTLISAVCFMDYNGFIFRLYKQPVQSKR